MEYYLNFAAQLKDAFIDAIVIQYSTNLEEEVVEIPCGCTLNYSFMVISLVKSEP